jgi:hypothetical protein
VLAQTASCHGHSWQSTNTRPSPQGQLCSKIDDDSLDEHDLLVPGVPAALQKAFRRFYGIYGYQQLIFEGVNFTLVETQFVHDFMRPNPRVVNYVTFERCTFASKNCADILKECFAHTAMTNTEQEVVVTIKTNEEIQAEWFPWVFTFATRLSFENCGLDDANFKKVVDILLDGNDKKTLRYLSFCDNSITSNGLVDVERIVEQCSQVYDLDMDHNRGLLDSQDLMQSLCNKLKKNKSLGYISFHACGASEATANATITMFVDNVLPVNTTLKYVDLGQTNYPRSENDRINERRLEPWLTLNERLAEVLAGVQELLNADDDDDNNDDDAIPDGLWRHLLNAAMEDVDRDKSALFLLVRHAIVGPDACSLRDKVVEALKESALVAVVQEEEQQEENQAATALQAKIE